MYLTCFIYIYIYIYICVCVHIHLFVLPCILCIDYSNRLQSALSEFCSRQRQAFFPSPRYPDWLHIPHSLVANGYRVLSTLLKCGRSVKLHADFHVVPRLSACVCVCVCVFVCVFVCVCGCVSGRARKPVPPLPHTYS
jgi:hypothetical protein